MQLKSIGTHLAVAIAGGAIALGGFQYLACRGDTCDRTDTASAPIIRAAPGDTDPKPLPNPQVVEELKNTSRAFVSIAKLAQPAVVNINTVQMMKPKRNAGPFGGGQPPLDEFFGDDFFRRFFGPGGPNGEMPNQERERRGLGSGMIVDSAKGLLLTNNHVIADADQIKVTLADGRSFDAKVLGTDPHTDVAVVQIQNPPSDLTAVTLGDSDRVEVGDWAVAVGNPFGLSQTVTVGIISAKGRSDVEVTDYEDFIQTDAAINPGNSGGPLLNVDGEVIGINTAIFSRSGGYQGIGFAIPSAMARSVMDSIISGKKIQRGYMGVRLQDLTDDLAKKLGAPSSDGALVTEIVPDSPAAKGGLQTGDIITTFAGKRIKSSHELRNLVGFTAVGKAAQVMVLRDGTAVELQLVLAERPADEIAQSKPSDNKLGVAVAPVTEELRGKYRIASKEGVVITDMEGDGLSAKIGLQEGDVLLEINRQPIKTMADFTKAAELVDEKHGLLLLVERQGNRMFLALNR